MAYGLQGIFSSNSKLVQLTVKGEQVLDKEGGEGDMWNILWYLKGNGASSVKEISQKVDIPFPRAQNIIKGLVKERWAQWV